MIDMNVTTSRYEKRRSEEAYFPVLSPHHLRKALWIGVDPEADSGQGSGENLTEENH